MALLAIYRRSNGRINEAGILEIGRRLRAGETPTKISRAIGLSDELCRKRCRAVAAALGIVLPKDRWAARRAAIRGMVESGATNREIADHFGISKNTVGAAVKSEGAARYRLLPISAEKRQNMRLLALEGMSSRDIADALDTNQSSALRISVTVQNEIAALAPCECGRPRNHGGRCNLMIDPAIIRQRLLDGDTAADIARTHNRKPAFFKPKYIDPVITELTAEGHVCGCGVPYGHRFVCSFTASRKTRPLSPEGERAARDLVRAGASEKRVRDAVSVNINAGRVLVERLRAELSAEGVICPCGLPLNHPHNCVARLAGNVRRTAFKFTSAAALSMSRATRTYIARLARKGWPVSIITQRSGESVWRIKQVVQELERTGRLPDKCAGCEKPRGHRGVCTLPKLCACGRPRNHRGLCRRPDGRHNHRETFLSDEVLVELRRRYKNQESIKSISRSTGVIFRTVQKFVAKWRAESLYALRPCACGRPAYHPGGCYRNTPGALSPRWVEEAETRVRAGVSIHEIAAALDVTAATILKHTVTLRQALLAEGVSCECGRIIGHGEWCKTKWRDRGMPLGPRAIPRELVEEARRKLRSGALVTEIVADVGISADKVRSILSSMALDDQLERKSAVAARKSMQRHRLADDASIVAAIRSAIPAGMWRERRDDLTNDLFTRIKGGSLDHRSLGREVRRMLTKQKIDSRFAPPSLDDRGNGGRSLTDRATMDAVPARAKSVGRSD